ncbi:uncharacterized protein DUF4227 [Tumebacillus sp. BK434]|uniref:DUF4227 family protein n=1 Tax=Tumebacillus sp. BK434 TaxID=2512169 RepID=UPI0010E45C43|nr:DUF4227 family protein [Tumebacillus sp. BK434]TCP59567.1 uncharacterized protein DUF4227 [Tumebacillus sp. BK434]
MIISVRQLSRFLRMVIFTVIFSFICFKVLMIVQEMIEPANKYKEPVGGDAVKVEARYEEAQSEAIYEEMLDRLSLFFEIGE